MGMMTLVRVLEPEMYNNIMVLKGQLAPKQPLPRWHVTIRDASGATPLFASISRAMPATYWWDVPWNPYRRTPNAV